MIHRYMIDDIGSGGRVQVSDSDVRVHSSDSTSPARDTLAYERSWRQWSILLGGDTSHERKKFLVTFDARNSWRGRLIPGYTCIFEAYKDKTNIISFLNWHACKLWNPIRLAKLFALGCCLISHERERPGLDVIWRPH